MDTWRYDANGNRTHEDGVQVASYDAQDRLTQYKDNTYQYNALGQLTEKTTPGGTETYDYDVFGNLRGVTLANGDTIEYLIDPKGRRIGKKVNGAMTQKLLYLGQLNPIAELYPDNSVKNLFIYAGQDAQVSWSTGSTGTTADKPNVPSAMERYDESGSLTGKYRIISNHLGSVVMVVNAETGDIAQEIEYDVWGNVLNDTNPNFQPFYFAGGIYDIDTKLTRFGARDYDAETGRWTAKDPILFGGGLTSLYDYVGGDPVNFVDVIENQRRVAPPPRQGYSRNPINGRLRFNGLEPASQRSPYPRSLPPATVRERLRREQEQRMFNKMLNEPRMEQLKDLIDALENMADSIENKDKLNKYLRDLKKEYNDLINEFGEPNTCPAP